MGFLPPRNQWRRSSCTRSRRVLEILSRNGSEAREIRAEVAASRRQAHGNRRRSLPWSWTTFLPAVVPVWIKERTSQDWRKPELSVYIFPFLCILWTNYISKAATPASYEICKQTWEFGSRRNSEVGDCHVDRSCTILQEDCSWTKSSSESSRRLNSVRIFKQCANFEKLKGSCGTWISFSLPTISVAFKGFLMVHCELRRMLVTWALAIYSLENWSRHIRVRASPGERERSGSILLT